MAAVENTASSPRSATGPVRAAGKQYRRAPGSVLGTSRGASVIENVDVTDSNRRVGSRGHGGMAGAAGDHRPYAECAEHVPQLEGESPFHSLMDVK